MDKIIIFTDGSCQVHQKKLGGWGAVLIYKEIKKEIFGGEYNTTNNRMEIRAVIEALKIIKTTHIPIEVYSDAEYVVRCFIEGWYHKWLLNGWKSSKSKVKNVDLWKELIELVEMQDDIQFFKVKAHVGIELNELADDLANIGLEKLKNLNIEGKNKYE
jgi:ribonuclease HI